MIKVLVSLMFTLTISAQAMAGSTKSSPVQSGSAATVDVMHAKPMPLPQPATRPNMGAPGAAKPAFGASGSVSGSQGTGVLNPMTMPGPAPQAQSLGAPVTPQDFGTGNIPYTTARVDAYYDNTQFNYPFRAAGRLFFNIGSSTFVCSASLIKPGVIVTAAHCVANFGHNQFYSNWTFVPGYSANSMGVLTFPYGWYSASTAVVLTSYFNGSDSCAQSGVICQDDVAVIRLNPVNGNYPGVTTGWFGYGWNGYDFVNNTVQISQLGYPVALDGGRLMQRTDSQGFADGDLANNTIIGSLMTGGSSGGPWVVNLGIAPTLSGTSFGEASAYDTVEGVTSWGYIDTTVKVMGAAPFTSGNITVLVSAICTGAPAGSC